MKYNLIVLGLLLGTVAVSGINVRAVKKDSEEGEASTANELDALMDKYDNADKKPSQA